MRWVFTNIRTPIIQQCQPITQAEFSKACTQLVTNANAPELIRKVLEQRGSILKMESTDGENESRMSRLASSAFVCRRDIASVYFATKTWDIAAVIIVSLINRTLLSGIHSTYTFSASARHTLRRDTVWLLDLCRQGVYSRLVFYRFFYFSLPFLSRCFIIFHLSLRVSFTARKYALNLKRHGGVFRHPVFPAVQDGQPKGRHAQAVDGTCKQDSRYCRQPSASSPQIVRYCMDVAFLCTVQTVVDCPRIK